MNKAYKFRIMPNSEQQIMFAKTFGCVRFVYNRYLDKKINLYKNEKVSLSYTKYAADMSEMKHADEYGFLKEVDSIALQQSLRHLDTAFQNFFQKSKNRVSKIQIKEIQPKKLYDQLRKRKYQAD